MVKITNITGRPLSRRLPNGAILNWSPGESKDVESKRLLEQVSRQECFVVGEEVGKKDVGGGLKTGVRRPKANRKPSRTKPKKDKVKSKAKSKKPKGLRKPKKRAD
tara:strand:+ start:1535 stop:1852 length:318 start_codon:yes stop_codon:yes gene_type:complete